MGYNFEIRTGRVRRLETMSLINELLLFAAELELDVLPIHLKLSGVICEQSLPEVEHHAALQPRLVERPVAAERTERAMLTRWFQVDGEQIEGVVLYHHYEPWSFMWNLSHNAVLADYSSPGGGRPDSGAKSAREWTSLVDEFFRDEPVKLQSENLSERRINLHCPWRRSDVAAACDALRIVSRHGDDFAVHDEYGVWPKKNFTKWKNLGARYADAFGRQPENPDIADEL